LASHSRVRFETPDLSAQVSDVDALVGFPDAAVVLGLNGDGPIYLSPKEHPSRSGNAPIAALAINLGDQRPVP